MAGKANDKILLSNRESCPPPGYVGRSSVGRSSVGRSSVGRSNAAFEYDVEADHRLTEIRSNPEEEYARSTKVISNGVINKKKIQSICLCTASVYPHYHGETIIDDNVYDEILIIDPKELQTTANKNVRLKGQCLRICKVFILVLIFLVGLACGLYGVAHYFIVNEGGNALMTNGDVKLLHYSTYFCQGVRIEPSDIQRSLLVLERKEGEVAAFNYNVTRRLALEPAQRTYEQSFYAIKQGVMHILIETEGNVDVLIFDEKSKLDNWKNNRNYALYNFKRRCCRAVTIKRGVYTFRAEQDRQAFFVVYNDGPSQVNINLTLLFERNLVDYKKKDVVCSADFRKGCSVPISFASTNKVVVEIPRTSNVFHSQKVEWVCEARVWFYICVFAGIFIAFIIIMIIVYCFFKCCFCDPCCCCFCCYIVPHEEKKTPKIVQYHCGTLRHNTNYAIRTPRGPRAEQMRTLNRHDSNESIIKHGYTTSDTSDTEGRETNRRGHMSRTNSTATTHSMSSAQFTRRRSSSSIGSDIKRGLVVDEAYEELPPKEGRGRRSTANERVDMNDDVDGYIDPRGLRRVKMSRRARREVPRQENNDGYYSDIEKRLRLKKAQFSDSEGEEEVQNLNKRKAKYQQKPVSGDYDDDDDDDYDFAYDVVGFQVATPSKSTAEKIDTLPLGPSGAPPEAPPKSAASIKGKPGLQAVRSLENIEILPNGMTRLRGEKLQKSKSDVMQRNGRKQSPVTPNVIILNGKREMYNTYERGNKKEGNSNGLYNRTISLDSGLDAIDTSARPRIKQVSDVKF